MSQCLQLCLCLYLCTCPDAPNNPIGKYQHHAHSLYGGQNDTNIAGNKQNFFLVEGRPMSSLQESDNFHLPELYCPPKKVQN